MTKFADQLFDDLMQEYRPSLAAIERPPARRGSAVSRPVWVTGGAVGVAGALTAGFVVLGGGGAAYAVTQNPDGTVKVAINRPSGIAGANQALQARGIRAVVVPVGPGCPDLRSLVAPAVPGNTITASSGASADGSLTFDATGVPAGQTALVAVDSSGGRTTLGMTVIEGTPPDCVSSASPPPPPAGSSASTEESGSPGTQDDGGPSTT